jgi:hypothetical protein
MAAAFTSKTFQAFLVKELAAKFPTMILNVVTVSKPDGSPEFVIEVVEPVKTFRIFRPSPKGGWAHAKVWVAEFSVFLEDHVRRHERAS